MSAQQSFQVAGVDGCKAGWFVVVTSPAAKVANPTNAPFILEVKHFFVAANFAEVLSKTTDCKLVCVDIPIGLSDGDKPRECDIAARQILGRRASSIFPPPIRPCLSAKNYWAASKICLKYSGKKLNRQSFFLLDKIRQVDNLITPALQQRVCEIHPEILFWALNNKKPMQYNKRKFAGRNERMKLLTRIFQNVEEIVAEARKPKKVAPDDILDALVAVWTASQIILQKAQTLPENPHLDSKDLRMEIVYPA
jgi:predicted RNase H-like nuclease